MMLLPELSDDVIEHESAPPAALPTTLPPRVSVWRRVWAGNRWWFLRILALPVHLLVFCVIVFFLVRLIPGDPILTMSNGQLTDEQYAQVAESLGFTGTVWDQLVAHVAKTFTFDFGTSIMTGRVVGEDFAIRLPQTVELALMAMVTSIVLTVVLAQLCMSRPNNPISRAARVYSRLAGAIPEFCYAVIAIFLFYVTLHWVPAPTGRVDYGMTLPPHITGAPFVDAVLQGQFDVAGSILQHMVLPVGVMAIAYSSLLLKILLSGLDEAIDAPSTRYRVASGASPLTVWLSVYRRAAPPAVTMSGTMFGYLLGGSVIIESLFSLGAMGQFAVQAVNTGDIVALQSFLIVIATLSLVVFLIVDLVNMSLDPRRRPGAAAKGV
jgi:peptide/nickel transport system permease protein